MSVGKPDLEVDVNSKDALGERHGSKMGALMKRNTAVVLASCWARIIFTSILFVP